MKPASLQLWCGCDLADHNVSRQPQRRFLLWHIAQPKIDGTRYLLRGFYPRQRHQISAVLMSHGLEGSYALQTPAEEDLTLAE